MRKIKVGVVEKELKARKTDFRYTRQNGNGIRYEDANFRPEKVNPAVRIKLLPYTLPQVAELAERDKLGTTGWKYFPRFTYYVKFFYTYRREGDGQPRNEHICQLTYSPYPTRTEVFGKGNYLDPNDVIYRAYAERELKRFWSDFETTVKRLGLTQVEIDKLRKRIESKFV